MICATCEHAVCERSVFLGKNRCDLRCGNPDAGHRTGWIVETAIDRNIVHRQAPVWCPEEAKQNDRE